jgi:hypothetical protein
VTTTEAVRILIKHAARDVAGQGCGLRNELSEQDRTKVREAVCKLYRSVYGFDASFSDLRNLGL